jgi:hypothetical protein
LIDGHNLIGQMPDISLADPDDEAQLATQLRRYAARTGHRLTVIFDGGLPGGPSGELSGGKVQVVFAPTGRPADPLIIGRIRKVRDRSAWLVISSDQEIRDAAARHRVRTQSSEEFAAELISVQSPPAVGAADLRQVPPTEEEVEAWLREFGRR